MAWNHVPLKRGSQRKSTSRKVLPSLGPGRRVVDHVITWRSHTAAVLLATAPLAPATPGHLKRYKNAVKNVCFPQRLNGFSSHGRLESWR